MASELASNLSVAIFLATRHPLRGANGDADFADRSGNRHQEIAGLQRFAPSSVPPHPDWSADGRALRPRLECDITDADQRTMAIVMASSGIFGDVFARVADPGNNFTQLHPVEAAESNDLPGSVAQTGHPVRRHRWAWATKSHSRDSIAFDRRFPDVLRKLRRMECGRGLPSLGDRVFGAADVRVIRPYRRARHAKRIRWRRPLTTENKQTRFHRCRALNRFGGKPMTPSTRNSSSNIFRTRFPSRR